MISRLKVFVKDRLLYPYVLCRSRSTVAGVCLTFDDGPHPECTPRILDILDRERAKATFFCVGERMDESPEIVARARDAGHDIANHSMTHAEFARLDDAGLQDEIDPVYLIRDGNGIPLATTSYLRPPKGTLNRRVLSYCLRAGHRIVLWSKDPEDFRAPVASEVLRYFERHPITAGDVVLLHDRIEVTVEVLPEILHRIKLAGLFPVTVSDLFGARPLTGTLGKR